MYLIYSYLLVILGILLSPIILLLFILKPKLRAGFWQKIGFYKKISQKKPVLWFHAVSVGEVNAVEALIKKICKNHPEYNIVLTTVTKTGYTVAVDKLGNFVKEVLYFPYDFNFSVKMAIKAINPCAVIVAETEIWPNFSHEVKKAGVPLLIVNGRISPNSYKGYKKFKLFFKNILKNYTLILMQTEDDKKRIIDIGAPGEITEVMGNLKFDVASFLTHEEICNLKKQLHLCHQQVLIAGSTHNGEDEIILNVFQQLRKKHNKLKLLIAPRHPERNEKVIRLISETGLNFGLRSKNSNFIENEIIVLDTMGELSKLYSISNIAFIGGSFSNTGGHNPLEAAIYQVPVLSGPTVFNFKDIYKFLTNTNAAIIVKDEKELYSNIDLLLSDQEKYNQISSESKKIFKLNKGVLDLAMDKIINIVNK